MRRVCLCVADKSLQLLDRVHLPRLKLRSCGFMAVAEVCFDRHSCRGVEASALPGDPGNRHRDVLREAIRAEKRRMLARLSGEYGPGRDRLLRELAAANELITWFDARRT